MFRRLGLFSVITFFGVAFCLSPSASAVEKEKDDAAIIAKQIASYPIATCVVTSGKLGSMGKTVDYLHEGRLVRFCCSGCIPAFKKNPDLYLAKIDQAAKARFRSLVKDPPAKSTKEGSEKSAEKKAACACGPGGCGSAGGCGSKPKSGCGSGCGGCR